MNKLRQAMSLLFYRPSKQVSESQVQDHTSREIKGSIYTLLSLFLLVAVTSYIPLDTFNILNGRIATQTTACFFNGSCFLEA